MKHSALRHRALAIASGALVASLHCAAAGDHAHGRLTLDIDGKTRSAELAHVYFVVGPDAFDPSRTTRQLVFSVDDLGASIEACADIDCATVLGGDGLVLALDASGRTRFHARMRPTQSGGFLPDGALKLSADAQDHVAGTLTLDSMGVKTAIEFDATLRKAFAPSP